MQHQLKACGDLKTSSRPSTHRRSLPKKSSANNNNNNTYLATDVTMLDINTMFQSKKSKRNGGGGGGGGGHHHGQAGTGTGPTPTPTPTSPFPFLTGGMQTSAFAFPPYLSQAALYSNLELINAANSELPPLMSVPAYKPSLLHGFGDSHAAMDFAQFTEELNAIQNSTASSYPSATSSAGLFSSDNSSAAFLSALPKTSSTTNAVVTMSSSMSSSSRNAGARKNRMVEVKTINDRSVVVVSDPQAATASSRTTMVPLSRQVLGLPKALEESKKKPISEEPLFSRKVFIGGLPIDVTEEEVWTTFGSFGKVLVDWPRRPEHGTRAEMYDMDVGRRNPRSVSGYVFLVFQNEQSVQELVNSCELYDGKYYLQLSSPTMADKAVQVRAWRLLDIDYFCDANASVDHRRTVFIGGVPRPTRASDLAKSLQAHYGKVSYVGIDIDPELKYPKGAARVTFATSQSFVRAISGRFVQVTHADTNKRVEIKPYVMEDQHCDECHGKLCKHNYAPYFCGDPSCLQYYCEACWDRMHYEVCQTRGDHRPMVRTGDQTRVLPRPPHHPSNYHHHRQHLQHQQHYQALSMDHHHQNQSIMCRIVNRNVSTSAAIAAAPPHSPKQFSAIPTAIGY